MGVFASRIMQEIKLGTPLSDLEVGTSVYINENGNPIEYLIVNQGIPENSSLYDESCDGTWVLRKDIHSNRLWDSSNNDYQTSDIFTWLNGTFLGTMDTRVQDMIVQVKIPYQNGTGNMGWMASGADGLSCKIFLLSGYEMGWTNIYDTHFASEGAKLSYFELGNSNTANNKRIANYNGSATSWWLRSPYVGSPPPGQLYVWYVYSSGVYGNVGYNSDLGVRPALVLPFNTIVDNMLIA